MEICLEPIVDLEIDSRLAVDGSVVGYRDRVVGFYQGEGVDLDNTLALGFSQMEGVDPKEGVVLVVKGFEVHGRDTHDYKLLIAPRGLLHVSQAWYFNMNGVCAVVYHCDFDRSNLLVFVLYGDVVIFVGCP